MFGYSPKSISDESNLGEAWINYINYIKGNLSKEMQGELLGNQPDEILKELQLNKLLGKAHDKKIGYREFIRERKKIESEFIREPKKTESDPVIQKTGNQKPGKLNHIKTETKKIIAAFNPFQFKWSKSKADKLAEKQQPGESIIVTVYNRIR